MWILSSHAVLMFFVSDRESAAATESTGAGT